MTKAEPRTLSSKEAYHGSIFSIRVDEVQEDGAKYVRDIVVHPGSAVIIPYFDDGSIALVKQYRHPAKQYLLEVAAGSRDGDEKPQLCAARELKEEVGLEAERLDLMAEFFPSPGFCSEKMWLYVATGLKETGQQLEEDELVEIVRLPLEEAARMVQEGVFHDAKTIIAIMLLDKRIQDGRV
jgi:ADP-ribose pyrophosphatase